MLGISIICVSYYSRHLLKKTIADIISNIDHDFEILIVNNSPEESLDSFESETVKILEPGDNIGYGAAINYGVTKSKYENLLIINPDIELSSFKFNYPTGFFIAGGIRPLNPYGYKFPSLLKDTLGILFPYIKILTRKKIQCSLNSKTYVDWITGSLIATNKSTMNLLKGFDEDYFLFYEEVDLCFRAMINKIPVFIDSSISFEASLLRGKASNADVKWLKLEAEKNSFITYNTKHSNHFGFIKFLIRFTSITVLILLKIIPKTRKTLNAIRYYKLYSSI